MNRVNLDQHEHLFKLIRNFVIGIVFRMGISKIIAVIILKRNSPISTVRYRVKVENSVDPDQTAPLFA